MRLSRRGGCRPDAQPDALETVRRLWSVVAVVAPYEACGGHAVSMCSQRRRPFCTVIPTRSTSVPVFVGPLRVLVKVGIATVFLAARWSALGWAEGRGESRSGLRNECTGMRGCGNRVAAVVVAAKIAVCCGAVSMRLCGIWHRMFFGIRSMPRFEGVACFRQQQANGRGIGHWPLLLFRRD